MPQWIPEKLWKDEEVFIIGGGVSLKAFDWNLLHPELTIGCNSAYTLGSKICNLCIFGDFKFFEAYKADLECFSGVVFTNVPKLAKFKSSWLWYVPRKSYGLGIESLGWNNNTGASAINLALLLGAKKIYLLGFDMELTKGKNNYHDKGLDKPDDAVFPKFLSGFDYVAKDLPKLFPDAEIININKNSNLKMFPTINPDTFWKGRNK